MIETNARRFVLYWLGSGCFLIFIMVLVGGITRLTGSGLSMVDWKLIMGTIPPLNESEWLTAFEAYKQFPEYDVKHAGFDLSDFKLIFFWEYLHRMIGRLIGLVFIIPFIILLIRKKIRGVFIWKLLLLFSLGGLQGFFGWYMVKSGLAEIPHVSHFRLALHLITAFVTFALTWWLILSILFPERVEGTGDNVGLHATVLIVLTFIQIIYGAFVAGLKAGLFYNTYPKMGDKWIAEGVYAMEPFYRNFIEGVAGVQFVHRYIAIFLLLYIFYMLFRYMRKAINLYLGNALIYLAVVGLTQVLLGIFTLIYGVPLALAVLHQIGAFLMLMVLIYLLRVSRYAPVKHPISG
ncbi:MAG: COX15/CtaA family protein [Vicingaceae bacterium]